MKPAASTTISTTCAHCGEPVAKGLLVVGDKEQFCCAGCRTARAVITSCGLERYYELLDRADDSAANEGAADGDLTPGAADKGAAEKGAAEKGAAEKGAAEKGAAEKGSASAPEAGGRRSSSARRPVRASSAERYASFDEPAFLARYAKPAAGGLATADLFLEGVHCAACLWLVERLPRIVPGVAESRLDLRRSLLHVTWDPRRAPLSTIATALHRLGYPPHPAREASARDARRRDERRQLVRLGVAGACAGNVMVLALAMYAGLFDAMEPAHLALLRWVSMGLSVVAVAWPGAVFFRGALAALRARSAQLDLPIALGLGLGALWGVVNTVRGHGELYFDSISVLVFALLVGRYVQQRQQRWSADAVELLFSLTPSAASIVPSPESDDVREVPLESVQPGDLALVRSGETIPADGVVVRGASTVDRSLLTGEARPAAIGVDDAAVAGSVNIGAPLVVRIEATGEQTRIGRLLRLMEETSQRRAGIVRFADRIAGWFVVGAMALAAATAAIWWQAGAEIAIERAVALLIVTCPCGLGLATPLAVTVAIGRAARCGMLVKGGEALERLGSARARRRRGIVLLDKTGTVTEGRLDVAAIVGDEAVLALAAAAERHAVHPVAEAIDRAARRAGAIDPDDLAVLDVHHPVGSAGPGAAGVGGGVSAVVEAHRVVVGSASFVAQAAALPRWVQEAVRDFGGRGLTPTVVAVDGVAKAVLGLGDLLRDDSAQAVARIRRGGWDVAVLSGDDQRVVDLVGARLGIPAEGRLGGRTPEEKLAFVQRTVLERPTIMVGDGVNDAAALAAATVGVAVHGGAEASLAAADVHLSTPGIGAVADLLAGARRTMRVIRVNIAVSLLYNVVAAALCMGGMISPLLAAVLMPASSLTVVAISLRGRSFVAPGRSAAAEGAIRRQGATAAPPVQLESNR